MYKFWLSLALGAGLLACGTPDTPQPSREMDGGTRPDDDEDEDEDEKPTTKPRADAGRDAGKADAGKADAGRVVVPRNDGGMTLTPPNSDAPGGGTTGTGGNSGGSTPPAGGSSTPPTSGGSTPPAGGGDTPPAGGGDTPPAGGGDTPPASGGAPASGGGLGGGCSSNADCGSLTCFTTAAPPPELAALAPALANYRITFPGGYCTNECDSNAKCAGGSCPFAQIAALVPGISQCAKDCASDADCRDGYSCGTLPRYMGQQIGDGRRTCLPPIPPLPE